MRATPCCSRKSGNSRSLMQTGSPFALKEIFALSESTTHLPDRWISTGLHVLSGSSSRSSASATTSPSRSMSRTAWIQPDRLLIEGRVDPLGGSVHLVDLVLDGADLEAFLGDVDGLGLAVLEQVYA